MIAHISAVPLEELLPLVYGAGGLWAAVRAFAARHPGRNVRNG